MHTKNKGTYKNSYLGLRQVITDDEVTFSPTFRPGFFKIMSRFIRLLIGGELDHFQNHKSPSVGEGSLFLTNNSVRRLSVLSTTAVQRDGLVVALGVHVVVVHTRTTHVNDKTTPSCLLKTQ